jgi:hypothetical protein
MKTYPEFHDGTFNGLLIERNAAHFFLETWQHEKFILTARQMSALRLNDVREGNIIFDLEVFDSGEISVSDVLEAHHIQDASQAEAMLKKCREQNWLLIRINPSYGANLIAIASYVEVRSQEHDFQMSHLLRGDDASYREAGG